MKIEKLYQGQVFKNYKEMCEVLEIKVTTSNSKNAQFSELGRHCSYEKQGHKILIKEVYETPIARIETRGNKLGLGVTLTTPLTETNPKLAKQWNTEINGEITDNITRCTTDEYHWDCCECNKTIVSSPQKRLNPNKGKTDDAITCPYCTLSKQAKRVYETLEINNIKFKQEYTFKGLHGKSDSKRSLRFDFAILNSKNEVIGIIEYDGEYHDINKLTQEYDEIKNKYCEDNNIPLLRIHHKESRYIEVKIMEFLNIENKHLMEIQDILLENDNIIDSIKLLEKELLKLNKKLTMNNSKLNELLKN